MSAKPPSPTFCPYCGCTQIKLSFQSLIRCKQCRAVAHVNFGRYMRKARK